MPQDLHTHSFANGLTLLAEHMPHVRSASMSILVPAGSAFDPPDQLGLGSVLSQLITRGAGERDSVQLTEALDNLGLDHSESVGLFHMHFGAATVARNLAPGLEIYADILRRPHLPPDEVEPVKALALQDINSLEDDPDGRVLVELRKHLYPKPLSNDHRGTLEGINKVSAASLKKQYQALFRPNGTIVSVAGHIDWPALLDQVGRLLGDWPARPDPAWELGPTPPRRGHLDRDLEQTQITVGYPSVPIGHPDYYNAQAAVSVLSGGMSSRLFTEIREKHGLVYSVWAAYRTLKDRAAVICYAGSRNDRAQQTVDLLLKELKKLPQGVTDDEVRRVRVGLKTSLIMQQESTGARASALASDWYFLGRVRSFDEIQSAVEGLSPESITAHVRRHPPQDFRIVTMGPKQLDVAE